MNAIHLEDRDFVECECQEAGRQKGPSNQIYRIKSANGEWKWTHDIAAPVYDLQGRLKKWVGINLDISGRKQAEALWLEREQKYKELFQSISKIHKS